MVSISKIIFLGLFVVCSLRLSAQDAFDLVGSTLQLSRTQPGGSSRMLGLGGAQTALGGDISSASSNPAGLGFFNRSEFSAGLAFNYISTNSDYLNDPATDGRLNLNIGNIGAVVKNNGLGGDFDKGAVGISINRIADFQNQVTYEGFNPNDDFIQFAVESSFTDDLGNTSFGNDLAELAFEAFLINSFEDASGGYFVERDIYAIDENGNFELDADGNLIRADPTPDFPAYQTETVDSRGAAYQISVAYGVNYRDRLYLGANIGILTMSQAVDREYREIPTLTTLDDLVLINEYERNGIGVNATIGIIGRPVRGLLLGASYTTPSVYGMEQVRRLTLDAFYIDGFETYGFDYEPFTFTVITPSRLNLGATCFVGKYGFITTDFERVDYAGARLSNADGNVSFSDSNRAIDRSETVWNYRVGAEVRRDIFRLRGGYAYSVDPTDDGFAQSQARISFGGGIRTEDYYVDMAVIRTNGDRSMIAPYPGQTAVTEKKNTIVSFTFGVFF